MRTNIHSLTLQQGDSGVPGLNGTDGENGLPGEKGEAGRKGRPGPSVSQQIKIEVCMHYSKFLL